MNSIEVSSPPEGPRFVDLGPSCCPPVYAPRV